MMKSEADAGARKPVVVGWAEQNRVKVERAYPPGP
jgi:hypothetical protein